MKKNRLYYIAWLVTALFAMSCEDLEDTYDEFSGDGVIRYTGKCSDLNIESGWERLRVSWKGSIDPDIEKVKIVYQSELDAEPMVKYVAPKDVVEADLMDTLYLEDLQDAVYSVKVSNVATDGMESLVETSYGRPYTESHEDLRSFTRGIVNFYPVNDRLVVVLDAKNPNLREINLKYWGTDGKEHDWNILENMGRKIQYILSDVMFMLPNEDERVSESVGIDFDKPLTVERRGLLSGCIDTVKFDPVELSLEERVWSSGFVNVMMHEYGVDWEAHVDEVEVLELDYTLQTFQDLFYFPNLKKVILGKNRYMLADHLENISTTDPYFALTTLYYLSQTRGVEVEVYNKHYLFETYYGESYIDLLSVGNPGYPEWGIPATIAKIDMNWLSEKGCGNLDEMPEIEPLDTKGWVLTCSDTTYSGDKANGVACMLDDDPETVFEPGVEMSLLTITVDIDMKELQPLHGFKFVQANMGSSDKTSIEKDLKYLLSSLKIEVSENGYSWEQATYDEGGVSLGNAIGETTFIRIPQAKQKDVRYIRLTMNTKVIGSTTSGLPMYSLRIGDLIPYISR